MGVEAAEAIKKTLMAFAYTALIARSRIIPSSIQPRNFEDRTWN